MSSPFLTAEWRKLLILNYTIDPTILKQFLPYKTELDLWNEKCYVSLVGFRFVNTRLKGISIPFHRNFEEINLRFYVRYKEGNSWRRGVTFIREIVPRAALSFVANSIYSENYITLPTAYRWDLNPEWMYVEYKWKYRGEWNSISSKADPVAIDIQHGTEEEFITEHYWGYTKINARKTSQYQVEHPRWQYYPIMKLTTKINFSAIYGAPFKLLDEMTPDSHILAEGSEITVRSARKIQ